MYESTDTSKPQILVSMNSEGKTWYLYQGRGLLELAGPMGEEGIR